MKTYPSLLKQDNCVVVHFPKWSYNLTTWTIDLHFYEADQKAFNLGSYFFSFENMDLCTDFEAFNPKLQSFSGNRI